MKTTTFVIPFIVGSIIAVFVACLVEGGCKDKVEADEIVYQPIYSRALSSEEIAEIDWKVSDPDEPEESELVIICNCGMKYDIRGKEICFKSRHTFLTDFVKMINPKSSIPTWPDYIELEKDLIIGHTKFTNPNGSMGDHYGIVLEKGTKIYFRDKD